MLRSIRTEEPAVANEIEPLALRPHLRPGCRCRVRGAILGYSIVQNYNTESLSKTMLLYSSTYFSMLELPVITVCSPKMFKTSG